MTKNKLLQLTRQWMQRGEYDRVIRELESIPTSKRGAKLTAVLARARISRYDKADDAPAGWKEETIRDLEFFMDSATPEWREVLVQLKGKLDPSARPAPEPPRPKEAPEEKKESHGDPAPSSSSGADTGKIGRRVTSLMQNRKYGEALKAFEGLEPRELGADHIELYLGARAQFPSSSDIQRRLRELDRRAAGWCAPSTLFQLIPELSPGTPSAKLRETFLMNGEGDLSQNIALFVFSKYLLLLQTETAIRGVAPLDSGAWALFRKEEYWKLIDRFRNRSVQEMGLSNLLLFAYTAAVLHIQENNRDAGNLPSRFEETGPILEDVATLLNSVEEKDRSIVAWQLVSADVCAGRFQTLHCHRHWAAASRLAPGDRDLKYFCERISRIHTFPVDTTRLVPNAKAAWLQFEAQEKQLYSLLWEKSPSYNLEKGHGMLDRIFGAIPVDSCRTVTEGKRVHMSFSLRKFPLNVFPLSLFCSLMPEKLQERWIVSPCLEKQDHPSNEEVWYVGIQPQKSGRLDLTMYPWFEGAEDWSDRDLLLSGYGDLSEQLGNLTVGVNVGSVRIDRGHPTTACVLLSELEEELKKRKCEFFPTFDSYLVGGWKWLITKNTGDADLKHLRADIHRYWSLWENLSRDGGTGCEEDIEKWMVGSVTPAFFAIPTNNVRGDQKALILPALEHALKAEAGPNVFQVLGWATGKQFYYLDVLVYDLEALMKAAKLCARDLVYGALYFKTFLPFAEPIPVRDFELLKMTS